MQTGNNALPHLACLISPYRTAMRFGYRIARTAVQLKQPRIQGRSFFLYSELAARHGLGGRGAGRYAEIMQRDSCVKDLRFQMAFQLALHVGLSSPTTGSYELEQRTSCTGLFQQALVCTARNWPLALSSMSISKFLSSCEFREFAECTIGRLIATRTCHRRVSSEIRIFTVNVAL